MDDLVAFLRARIAEDDAAARSATQGEWVWSREFVTPPGYHHRTIGPLEPGDAAHIARHDPARVLREVEAKRRVVDECAYWEAKVQEAAADPTVIPYPSLADRYEVAFAVLRALGTAYADHPDYREEWRP